MPEKTIANDLAQVPQPVRSLVKPCVKSLQEVYGNDLESVLLYGSGTGSDFVPGRSNVNLLVILKQVSLPDLKKILKLVERWRKKKIAAPLVLTREHILHSTATFPVDFLDIKENHILLYGDDTFSGLEVPHGNLRLQCEEQLKGNLIRMRGAYLEVGLRRRGIEALLCDSLAGLIPVFRNLLRLKGKKPPVDKEAILDDLSAEFGVDGKLLMDIYKDKRGDEKIGGQEAGQALERYMALIEVLAGAADRM